MKKRLREKFPAKILLNIAKYTDISPGGLGDYVGHKVNSASLMPQGGWIIVSLTIVNKLWESIVIHVCKTMWISLWP